MTTILNTTSLTSKTYFAERAKIKENIINIIKSENMGISLRGSWFFNDFHLDITDLSSCSDIDLLLPGGIGISQLQVKLFDAIQNLLPMKVSIHTEDHLSGISLMESKIKNIFEYLILYNNLSRRKENIPDYFKAKTLLLLFKRVEEDQRFEDITRKIGGKSIENLYSIKIGLEKNINLVLLKDLISNEADYLTLSYYENCILENPDQPYFQRIQNLFFSTRTIDHWLKHYIASKLSS